MKTPVHLYDEADAIYSKLWKLVQSKMKDGDENMLAVLANAYFDYSRACEVLKDRGPVIAGETMVRKNPAFDIVKDTIKIIESYSAHFGLSPKSRGGDLNGGGDVRDDLDKLLDD